MDFRDVVHATQAQHLAEKCGFAAEIIEALLNVNQ
jgi:hypothetical protein